MEGVEELSSRVGVREDTQSWEFLQSWEEERRGWWDLVLIQSLTGLPSVILGHAGVACSHGHRIPAWNLLTGGNSMTGEDKGPRGSNQDEKLWWPRLLPPQAWLCNKWPQHLFIPMLI